MGWGQDMHIKYFFLIMLAVISTACTPTVYSRGNILDPDKLAEVKEHISTREDVAATLGTPTAISTFDEKTWYYVGRQTEQYSFFDPTVLKQEAVQVRFDDQGVVTSLTKLNLSEAHDIDPIERSTPTYGNDDTFIKQLMGNLSHPTPNMGNSNRHEGQ